MSRTSPGHCTVVGRVKNISDAPIDNIRVIAYIKDAGGKTLATDRGLVEYSPLAPGQVSPFRAIVRYEGSSESSAQIEFSANGAQVKFK